VVFVDKRVKSMIMKFQVNNCRYSLTYIQSAAFNVTHFESRITHLLYIAINTTEHGQVSQCLGFTKVSHLQYNVLEMSSMTIKALPPSPRYTCHDAT